MARGSYIHSYIRFVEECGFSAKPGKIVKGKIIFGHEVRSFQPEDSDKTYWLEDKSGYLMEKYKASGEPEWIVYAELEVKDTGRATDGFAEDYDSTYQVLRVIRLGK